MRAAWFGQSQASAPSARGQHRMRRLLAQVTVASLLLVTLGLAGLPTPGSQASAAQTGLGQPDDDGTGGGDGTLPAPALVQPTFIADSPPATATVGTAFSYSFTATGTPSPTFSSGTLPNGLTLTSAGVLSGVPTQSGAFTFTVAADNGVGQPAVVTRTIDVAGPGAVSWDAPPPATVGVPYSFAIQYTGYPAPTFTTSEVLPPGLTLSAEGVVSGTPTAAGSRVVTFNAAQLVSGSSLIMLEFVVNAALAPDAAPILTADAPPATADAGQPYSYTFTATGVPAPTFHLSSGLLPTGMTLTADGLLSGSPPSGGAWDFTVSATNSVGTVTGGPHTITVSAAEPGYVVGWGNDFFGQVSGVPARSDITAISSSYSTALALTNAGTVIGWGDNADGGLDVPSGLTGVTAISAGIFSSLALKRDGTVVAWGSDLAVMSFAAGLSGVAAIAVGDDRVLALKNDGTVVEQIGSWAGTRQPMPAGLSSVTAISVGEFHAVALKADGSVVMWGDDQFGQLNQGLTDVVKITAAGLYTLVLHRDGTVETVGTEAPKGAPALNGVVALAGNDQDSFAITTGGVLHVWGSGPPLPKNLANVIAVSPEYYASNALIGRAAPAFTAATPPTAGHTGTPYSYTFTATGTPTPTFSNTGVLPAGLTLSPEGVLSGTPTTGGSFDFTVTASNGVASPAEAPVTITVDDLPAFTAFTPTDASVGTAYSYQFTATGYPAPTFTVPSSDLPPGLTLSPEGLLSGTPTAAGDYSFTVTASNSVTPDGVPAKVSIRVTAPPVFTADEPPAAALGVPYSYTFTASGSPAPTFTRTAGALPKGLTLSAAGVLSGTPQVSGDWRFTVTADNGTATPAAGKEHVLQVSEAAVFTADTPPTATINQAYSYTFTASGHPAPTFAKTSGTLPAGLTLSADGVLSGTPTAGGISFFTITAENTVDLPAYSTHRFVVSAPPVFTADTPPNAELGQAYSYSYLATGTPRPDLNLSSGTLPAGLTLTNGVLSGTPTEQGTFEFTVSADNSIGSPVLAGPRTLVVTAAPLFTADAPPHATAGTAYDYSFAASGTPAPVFSVTAGTPPDGLTLTADGRLSGTPSTGGVSAFTVSAGNGIGAPATAEVTFTVEQAPALTAATPPDASLGAPYSYAFTATGTPAPTFAVSTGNLPAGLTLSDGGLLTGTPIKGGEFEFTVTADNGVAPVAPSRTLTISVTDAPLFTAVTPPSAVAGEPYSYTFAATGSPAPTFALTAGTLPAGLTLTPDGVLSGTPTDAESPSFTITASNGVGADAVWVVPALLVNPGELDTVIVAPPATGGTGYPVVAGAPFTFVIDGQDANGNPLPGQVATFSVAAGSVFPGIVSGNTITFIKAGTHTITVTVGTASTTIEVVVAAGPPAEVTLVPSTLTVKQGGSLTLAVSGADAYGNDVGDLTGQAVFSSDVTTDVIDGATITFPHASPHVITATLGTLTSRVTVEVVPTAVTPTPTPTPTTPPTPDPTPTTPPTPQPTPTASAPGVATPSPTPTSATAVPAKAGLAKTGTDPLPGIIAGGASVLLGLLVLMLARRRRAIR